MGGIYKCDLVGLYRALGSMKGIQGLLCIPGVAPCSVAPCSVAPMQEAAGTQPVSRGHWMDPGG